MTTLIANSNPCINRLIIRIWNHHIFIIRILNQYLLIPCCFCYHCFVPCCRVLHPYSLIRCIMMYNRCHWNPCMCMCCCLRLCFWRFGLCCRTWTCRWCACCRSSRSRYSCLSLRCICDCRTAIFLWFSTVRRFCFFIVLIWQLTFLWFFYIPYFLCFIFCVKFRHRLFYFHNSKHTFQLRTASSKPCAYPKYSN